MKIVIELNEELYDYMKSLPYNTILENIVLNGTQLPKGHGRLIDESKIDWLVDSSGKKFTFEERIKNTSPTIIEADKESD